MSKGKTLYIGVDDSNHAGKIPGEIFVATFSFDPKYINRKEVIGNVRSGTSDLVDFLKGGGDYRFTIRTPDSFTHSRENAAIVGSTLILNYFREHQLFGKIEECVVDVDGGLCSENKQLLGHDLAYLKVPKISVHNFTKFWRGDIPRWRNGRETNKKGTVHKGYKGCRLVWLADGAAHDLLREYYNVGLEKMESSKRCYPEKVKLSPGCWTVIN